VIELVGVTKNIRGTHVLDDVSITCAPGRVTALVGPNGSGKSMAMRVMAGLVKPTSGHVLMGGVRCGPGKEPPLGMGILIEGPACLDAYSGFENLRMLASIRGTVNDEHVRACIAAVGLDPFDRRRYKAYSLGMKQRLGIAAALMEEPDVVLLDEPTNALDSEGVELVLGLVARERARGAAVVLACHDEKVVRSLADEVWHMAEGRVVGHEAATGGAR
jgi:ABC-2 type transport system ATP-binding protein